MSIFSSKQIDRHYIKVRWQEPYVSHALNRTNFGTRPRGIYSGFNIDPVGYRSYEVNGHTPIGYDFQGNPNTYNKGAYDATSGYSIAVFSDNLGHGPTVVIPPNSVSGTFSFDFDGEHNIQKILALDIDYSISTETTGRVLAIDAAELVSNPEYLVIGLINLPIDGVSASIGDVVYDDNDYPRLLPFATTRKYGYMSPSQALVIDNISEEVDAIYCSNNDANVWWRNFAVSGIELGRLDFTGNIFYNQPTTDWNLLLATSGTVVSGIESGDVVFFQFPTDGTVSSVYLQIAPNNNLPVPPVGYQTTIFGMRCGNDFWFKNGQKWEVGEFKPFGVTSKYPNLKVGETGNPPESESVSGIFFDNAQVTVLPGGRDVRVYVNVSGSLPDRPIEEEHIVTNLAGQTSFTAIHPQLFWVNDDEKVDIKLYINGIKQTQYTTDTSGVYLSDSEPIWHWRKAGTRTVDFREPVIKDAVVTFVLEAHRSIQALEQSFLVTATSGQSLFTSIYPFDADNDIHDIQIWRNGLKVQYENEPLDPRIHGVRKINSTQIQFYRNGNIFNLPKDSVVSLRHEGGLAFSVSGGGGGGDYWFTPVDSHINPDTDSVYDIGHTKRFRNGNFGGNLSVQNDVYIGGKLNVSGGIDPTYLNLTPIDPSSVIVPANSFYVDGTGGNSLIWRDDNSIDEIVVGGTSGISIEEDELMTNPYPFDILAPRAVSLSTSGNIFLLTDFTNPVSANNYFGILREDVGSFGSGMETGAVRWRGKIGGMSGFYNGAVFVSGVGQEAGMLVQNSPGVSGVSIVKPGLIKNNILFLRPTDSLTL